MKKKLSVLIIDDHPMIIEGYQNSLLALKSEGFSFSYETANDCDEAIRKIDEAAGSDTFDVMLVDINLPASSDGDITSGEDIVVYARPLFPNTKFIILTMYNENHRLHNILRSCDPDGLLIKSDLTSNELAKAFKEVLNDPPYYSHTVDKYLRKAMRNNFALDDVNRKIIYYLSQGIKTKNLTTHVGLSLSAIEKRKSQIKALFGIESGDDERLLEEARKRGFV
ncbi:response regulator [Sungkyunkwania multivorans]|uniref:Response regulator n=1 Tax=Sungkyunkwania multivorans TaxID=1173618 RepID=A0ABW3D4S8_9FLAO